MTRQPIHSPPAVRQKPTAPRKWITEAQLVADSLTLAGRLPWPISGVAGVPRSGMIPASVIATRLGVPLYEADGTRLRRMGNGLRLNAQEFTGPIVVVEDSVNSGDSIRRAAPVTALTAAVYVTGDYEPDFHAVRLNNSYLFAWWYFGTSAVCNAAFDMDGVLCDDCPPGVDDDGPKYRRWIESVRPLHPARPFPCGAIVTARLEKYRPDTEAWLKRWGISYRRLVMGPWATRQERALSYCAKGHKGAEFAADSNLAVFFESCPAQARQIHEAAGKIVICPVTGEVWQ